jgi:hypothetical protein
MTLQPPRIIFEYQFWKMEQGFRTPYLQTGGDATFTALQNLGINFDSSLSTKNFMDGFHMAIYNGLRCYSRSFIFNYPHFTWGKISLIEFSLKDLLPVFFDFRNAWYLHAVLKRLLMVYEIIGISPSLIFKAVKMVLCATRRIFYVSRMFFHNWSI